MIYIFSSAKISAIIFKEKKIIFHIFLNIYMHIKCFADARNILDFQNASYFSRKNNLCVNILLTLIFVLQRIFFYLLYHFIYLYIFNSIIVNFKITYL